MSEMHEAAAADELAALEPEMRRVARLVTGTREGTDAVMREVHARVRTEPRPEGTSQRVHLWQQLCIVAEKAQCVEVSALPPLTAASSQAERLARALAALPARKRLAIALRHQSALDAEQMGMVLRLSPDEASALVAAAEAHLQALVRALGDTLHLSSQG